ncbi:hypothetical protein MIR68_012458 [Amoeboaphelidium protococcarum]|nr:hypothetical protein MIR68_012458 [Amoeboaphelidium protococcarum]
MKYNVLNSFVVGAIVVAGAVVSAQKPCDKADQYLVNQTFTLYPASRFSRDGVDRKLGGTIKVIDGCTFQVSNLTIVPAGQNTYWYGIPKGQPTAEEAGPNGVTLFPRIVNSRLASYNGQVLSFSLSQVSWSDMDGIGVYTEADNRMYMHAFWVEQRDTSGAASSALYGASILMSCMLLLMVLL